LGETVEPIRARALFLSDLHLGTKGCQAGMLVDFLKQGVRFTGRESARQFLGTIERAHRMPARWASPGPLPGEWDLGVGPRPHGPEA
jgi:hypothetical protein